VRAAEPDVTLVMVEQPGCHYCRAWHAEIGPAYPRTEAGAFAPLRTEQMHAIPGDLDFERRVVFTPTFVLVDAAGDELGRIEGYPGQDFFWPLLEQLLADAAGFAPPTTTPREEDTE
jgi:thioredoxin-related protein